MEESLTRNGRLDVEGVVRSRYEAAAKTRETGLCCPVEYDPKYLEAIPEEILERDYGCGDPTRDLRPGEVVLDLGSGAGKICYIAAQVVGPEGRVIGVDFNEEMLTLARRYRLTVAERLGYGNVQFLKGRIQDLRLDLEKLEAWLAHRPVRTAEGLAALEAEADRLRAEAPMIPDASVDVVVSNCVLNLVRPEDKPSLFGEIHRVLQRGGRAVISDIVSDEELPEAIRQDPELWSGCLGGAMCEDEFVRAFAEAGFYGITILKRQEEPWATVEGIEFRSVTLLASKGKEGPCVERKQAVIYRGPWRAVIDDDGHTLFRGERMAVCDKTFHIYTREPYREEIIPVEPSVEVPLEEAEPFQCQGNARRHPRESKGEDYAITRVPADGCCGPDGSCC